MMVWLPRLYKPHECCASNRLEMTTYVDGTPSTTRYQLDNGQTLAAIAGETSTFTLYGRKQLQY